MVKSIPLLDMPTGENDVGEKPIGCYEGSCKVWRGGRPEGERAQAEGGEYRPVEGPGQVGSRGGVGGESYIAGFDVGISPDLKKMSVRYDNEVNESRESDRKLVESWASKWRREGKLIYINVLYCLIRVELSSGKISFPL